MNFLKINRFLEASNWRTQNNSSFRRAALELCLKTIRIAICLAKIKNLRLGVGNFIRCISRKLFHVMTYCLVSLDKIEIIQI